MAVKRNRKAFANGKRLISDGRFVFGERDACEHQKRSHTAHRSRTAKSSHPLGR